MSLPRFPCGKCRAHTLTCTRWGAEREAVGRAVGVKLTPDTIVSSNAPVSTDMDAYRVIHHPGDETRELDGRAERANNRG